MLQLMWQAFVAAGEWPTFQYVSAHVWGELAAEPREVYYDLSAAEFVTPAIQHRAGVRLREDTRVGVSLKGLMHLRDADDDLGRFASAVRYLGDRAARFRPATSTASEQLTVTSEELRLALPFQSTHAQVLRQAALLRDYASDIWTSFNGPDASGHWQLTLRVESARRYREIQTVIDFLNVQNSIRAEEEVPWVQSPVGGQAPPPMAGQRELRAQGGDQATRDDFTGPDRPNMRIRARTEQEPHGSRPLPVPEGSAAATGAEAPTREASQGRVGQRARRIPIIAWLGKHDEIRVIDWITIGVIAAVIAALAVWFVTSGPKGASQPRREAASSGRTGTATTSHAFIPSPTLNPNATCATVKGASLHQPSSRTMFVDSPGQLAEGGDSLLGRPIPKGTYSQVVHVSSAQRLKLSVSLSNTEYGSVAGVAIRLVMTTGGPGCWRLIARTFSRVSGGGNVVLGPIFVLSPVRASASLTYVADSTRLVDDHGHILAHLSDGIAGPGVALPYQIPGGVTWFVNCELRVT
jgi:hypothetical protein